MKFVIDPIVKEVILKDLGEIDLAEFETLFPGDKSLYLLCRAISLYIDNPTKEYRTVLCNAIETACKSINEICGYINVEDSTCDDAYRLGNIAYSVYWLEDEINKSESIYELDYLIDEGRVQIFGDGIFCIDDNLCILPDDNDTPPLSLAPQGYEKPESVKNRQVAAIV